MRIEDKFFDQGPQSLTQYEAQHLIKKFKREMVYPKDQFVDNHEIYIQWLEDRIREIEIEKILPPGVNFSL
jgi:hypothetical protein